MLAVAGRGVECRIWVGRVLNTIKWRLPLSQNRCWLGYLARDKLAATTGLRRRLPP